MFKTFFLREIKMGLKQPMFYIFFILFTLLACLAIVTDSITIGGGFGTVFKNAPFIVTRFTAILGVVFGILTAAAYFNNAAMRDYRYQFNEIIFTTPVSKFGYFFGRFFGALVLSSLVLCGVFFGILIGTIIGPIFGWVEVDQLGPIPWQAFGSNFLLFTLPNMMIAGTLVYGLATKFRNTMVSFVGAMLILMAYMVTGSFLSDIDNEKLAAMLDLFGWRTYNVESKYFTPAEKNTISPGFGGLLFQNRLLWTTVSALLLSLFYATFSFKLKNKKVKAKSKKTTKNDRSTTVSAPISFQSVSSWNQFASFFNMNFRSITKSLLFKILFVFCAIMVVSSLWGGFEYFGLQSYPVTYKVMNDISDQSFLFLAIVMVFYSGELVWRDRDVNIHEVIGASPYSKLLSLLAKAFSLIAVILLLYASMVVFGILYQLFHGFTDIKVDLYFSNFLLDSLPTYITWSFVLIFIQIIINQKYIAYMVSLLAMFLLDLLLSTLDIESNLVSIGGGPSLMYSDMNGFGPGLTGSLWFAAYWIVFGLLTLVKGAAFWQRGTEQNWRLRIRNGLQNLKAYKSLFSVLLILFIGLGAYIYYNTHVLNQYDTSDQVEKMRIDYEKKYKQYESLPKLSIDDVKYAIDIFPEKRDVHATAHLVMRNKTDRPINYLHVILSDRWKHDVIIPNGKQTLYDDKSGYAIYEFEPLLPNDTMSITVKTNFISKGFENQVGDRSVVRNGSFFNNKDILPEFGYNPSYEIDDKFTRRKYDLKPKKRMPDLEIECGLACHKNYLSDGVSDWINVKTTISTSKDQIAIAPGSLLKQWRKDDRNYYHYKVDHPSQNFYSFMSAEYEIARRTWNDVQIEIYYDKAHDYNIDMMLDAVERSLKYFTEHFGPYYHKQARIIEFPRYATFAQAFPGTMPYSEAFGFIIDLEDENKNNVVDAVIAHEMAHQWWAHQVISSFMQGGTMLVESFAEYSSLMVMKNQLNDDIKMKEFLKYDFNRYLRGRSAETQKEVPLNKVEDQSYIHYGKGSVILYALQDYIGEDSVNAALRSFLEEYRYAEPPYPNTHDFLRHLRPRIPDSLQYLIRDWIEEITLYDFRLEEAKLEESSTGSYTISLKLYADKLKADSLGNETSVGINDYVDIGFFEDDEEEKLLHYERIKLNKKNMQLEFSLDKKPKRAAIDPRRILIERVISDNSRGLE